MKRIFKGLLVFVLVFLIAGCSGTNVNHTYEESGIIVAGDILYYREYTDTVDCEDFDVFPIYSNNGNYIYLEAYKSMSDACSSSLYIETDEGYIDVYYAFNTGVYDAAQLETALVSVLNVYESMIVPSEVTLALLQVEMMNNDKAWVMADALSIENAAKLYCAQTTCAVDEALSWADLSPYVSGLETSEYNLTTNMSIIAQLLNGEWGVYLERAGTGEWELPPGLVPSDSDLDDMVEDDN